MRNPATLTNSVPFWRILVLGLVIVIVFSIYVGRLFTLQVIQYDEWSAQADDNRTNVINLQAPRGIVYDRNGIVLAQNIPSYDIVIIPANLPDDEGEIQEIFRELSELTGVPVNQSSLDIP